MYIAKIISIFIERRSFILLHKKYIKLKKMRFNKFEASYEMKTSKFKHMKCLHKYLKFILELFSFLQTFEYIKFCMLIVYL